MDIHPPRGNQRCLREEQKHPTRKCCPMHVNDQTGKGSEREGNAINMQKTPAINTQTHEHGEFTK